MDSNNNNRSALASARATRERAEASMARTAAIVAESQAAMAASRAARERSIAARSDAEAAISSAQAFQEWMAQRMREMEAATAARSAALNANMPPRPPRLRIPRIRIPPPPPPRNQPGNAVLNIVSAAALDDDSFSYASLHTEAKRPRPRIKKILPKRRDPRLPARLRNREELDLRPFL